MSETPTTGTTTERAAAQAAETGTGPSTEKPDEPTWQERYSDSVMNTFGVPRLALVSGSGARVTDSTGREYLDLLAGIAVLSLGHGHPALVGAVADQVATLGHVSNFFTTRPQIALAERLLAIVSPGGAPTGSRVFLSNSGTEANEAALKIIRRHAGERAGRVLALDGAFHGRTLGALAITAKAAAREPFAPFGPQVTFIAPGDMDALRRELAVGDVAGLVMEPIQGEVGVRPLPEHYLAEATRAAQEAGALVVLDEIQTGVGRTGAWMAHHLPEADGITPDVVTLAKGLGGGMPIGATIALGEHAASLLGPGAHGTTFGGNPVAAAAALAVLDVVGAPGFLDEVTATGQVLADGIAGLGNPLVAGVRGRGLLLAVQLTGEHSAAVSSAAQDAGLIVNPVTPDAIRLAPPLILTREEAADAVERFGEALERVAQQVANASSGGGGDAPGADR